MRRRFRLVSGDYAGLVGWTVEAVEGMYSLAPITRLTPFDVTFTLPDALIGVTLIAVTLPATPPGWEDGPVGWLEHVEFRLSGGWIGEHSALAHLSVFPLDAVTDDPRYAAYQAIMADGLDSWPPGEALPTLFAVNAAQQIVAAPRIVELENLRGCKFFTAYGQDRIPLLRDSLLQGVTADEQAFISLVIPVTISTLSAEDDGPWLTLSDEAEIAQAYLNTYVPEGAAVIADSPVAALSPHIADLWEWLGRIAVRPTP